VRILVAATACLILGAPTLARTASAQEGSGVEGLTLAELERLADERFPEIHAARARVERLDAELREVRFRPLSGLRAKGVIAPTPERRGDATHSAHRDISISGDMGVLLRAQLSASVPIFTFGRLSSERREARELVEAGQEDLERARARTRARLHRAYNTMLLGAHTLSLLEQGQGHVERAQRHIEEQVEHDEGSVTETDRLRVEVLAAEVEARQSDARRAQRLGAAALRLLAGLEADAVIALPSLEPHPGLAQRLEALQESALELRPEVRAAQARLRASRASVTAARASYLPEIRLVADLTYGYASTVDDQLSPFVNDPFNFFRYGAGISLSWGLDFLTDLARHRQARARRDEARAQARGARERAREEVERAHVAVEESARLVAARRRGRRAARGWMFAVLGGIDVGVLEPEELVDALTAYFEQSFRYLEAVSEHNTAVTELEIASGMSRTDALEVE